MVGHQKEFYLGIDHGEIDVTAVVTYYSPEEDAVMYYPDGSGYAGSDEEIEIEIYDGEEDITYWCEENSRYGSSETYYEEFCREISETYEPY